MSLGSAMSCLSFAGWRGARQAGIQQRVSDQPVRQPYIGGQAVIEGVMMRSPKSFVVAVRRYAGGIAIREQEWRQLLPTLKFMRWPIFRGALVLAESLHNGFSALKFSSDHGLPPEEQGTKKGVSTS